MRTRAASLQKNAPAPRKRGSQRPSPSCDVVALLSTSAAIQDQIDATMAQPLTELHRIESALRYWTAFVQLKFHTASHAVWMPLCEALNIGMVLSENNLGLEYLDVFIAAQEAIFRAWMRGEQTGSYRLDGPGIVAVRDALEVHDAQIDIATRGQLAVAERTMLQRMNEGNHYMAEPLAA